jgi:hypothetical protein
MSPIEGIILKDGKPLPYVDIDVIVSMQSGKKQTYRHNTNAEGFFELPMIKKWVYVTALSHFAVYQNVKVTYNGRIYTIWSSSKTEPELYAELDPSSYPQRVTCDLDDEKVHYEGRFRGSILTRCRWTGMREA